MCTKCFACVTKALAKQQQVRLQAANRQRRSRAKRREDQARQESHEAIAAQDQKLKTGNKALHVQAAAGKCYCLLTFVQQHSGISINTQ